MRFFLLFLAAVFSVTLSAQITKTLGSDSTHLPRIKITADPSAFGPYYINTNHTNVYFVTEFPQNTSKVVMKYIDPKGGLLGEPKIKEGSNIEVVEWTVNAQDVGLTLASRLCIEVYYKTDSLAVYKIPYTVYPDTIKIEASAGWGPFVTNNYSLTDGYEPVDETPNTFTASNLPPRTDTVQFLILNNDSTVIDSLWVYADEGQYLDSAAFSNVRMDSLPLSARFVQVRAWCEGGPDDGLFYDQPLDIVQQKASLTTINADGVFVDSVPGFVVNQFIGQALMFDSTKNIVITNGPADNYNVVDYTGPYCFDMFSGFSEFSIETWLRFDLEKIHNASGYGEGMNIMKVDSVWGLDLFTYGSHITITLRSYFVEENNAIYSVDIPFEEIAESEWHHIAVTYYSYENSNPEVHLYLDGKNCENATFYEANYSSIAAMEPWLAMKTQPLIIGHAPGIADDGSYVTGADEVRLWHKALSSGEVKQNFQKKVVQSPELVGYWNFDDLRNRLGYASDISYKNNRGTLENGAAFIPQHPAVQLTLDTLIFKSSNKNTDSVTYEFMNGNQYTISSITRPVRDGYDTLLFDFSALPLETEKLVITGYTDESADKHDSIIFQLKGFPPIPVATPRYNWMSYKSDNGPDMGELFNSIVVSGLPHNASKVKLDLKSNDYTILSEVYEENSVPYRYSLTFNGTDNYVETLQQVTAPANYTLSLWFKTTSVEGGEIIGFSQAGKLFGRGEHDRKLIIRKDGSLRYYMIADETKILSAVNRYNDGRWHQVTVTAGSDGARLYVDGSLVDLDEEAFNQEKTGKWIMGLGDDAKSYKTEEERISSYFKGSLCEVIITNNPADYHWVNTNLYGLKDRSAETRYYYKFDDGKDDVVKDHVSGNNALIRGSNYSWFTANKISYVVWNHDVLNQPHGVYDFTATVFYPGGPDTGMVYQLGKIEISKPFGFLDFAYKMKNGFGYFNEGTAMPNSFDFTIRNATEEHAVTCKLYTLDHVLITKKEFVFGSGDHSGSLPFDMGETTPGSFISVQIDGRSNGGQITIPLFTNPLIKPVVKCDLGPFTQAIAPGTMVLNKKVTVSTEILSDLNRIEAVFYDIYDYALDTVELTQENDTTWSFVYNMAALAPPVTRLKLYYFMGQNPHPVLTEGPFPITIHKTRPDWFDFVPDTSFSDITQNGNLVTFSVKTPLTHKGHQQTRSYGKMNLAVMIPIKVQLIGGLFSGLDAAMMKAELKYDIKEAKLELNQEPDFYQNTYVLGEGNANLVEFNFEKNQDDSYELGNDNNLYATQNFDESGSIGGIFLGIINPVERIKDLIDLAGSVEPGSEVIKPSFNVRAYGAFKYSSRVHVKTDTVEDGWGSFGNLKIEADPDKPGYKESASYSFYAGALGIEFDVGAELLEGLISGYFGLAIQVGLGFGHSFVDIPKYKKRDLQSGAFQVYGRFFIESVKGWYTQTLWGPKLFYSYTFWGDDMSHCFPDGAKKAVKSVPAHSSWPQLTDEVIPVGSFTKMPMPVANPRITSMSSKNLFSWIEEGPAFGDRKLTARYYDNAQKTFFDKFVIELNNNALNSPVADGISNNLSFYTWSQSRYNSTTIQEVTPDDFLSEFARSQDIWFAVYDNEIDSLLIKEPLADDSLNLTSGRTEANPVLAVLSDSRVMIAWQVADLDNQTSAIWYCLLERTGEQWKAGQPQVLTNLEGIATHLEIASPGEEQALVTWLETGRGSNENKIMSVRFDGENWSQPETLADQQNIYYNYLSLNFNQQNGGLVFTQFVIDSTGMPYEKLLLLPWDNQNGEWMLPAIELMTDSLNHLQLPAMAVSDDGSAVVAIKIEELIPKSADQRISQIDLFSGDLNNPLAEWKRVAANPYVCDTTKQVKDLSLTWAGKDTLMLLSNEFPMLPTNSAFTPVNGVTFGDPYMNLVFRSFKMDESGNIQDIDENKFFTGLPEISPTKTKLRLYQNYPNPCNESTTITFDITVPGRAKLELFDVWGNLVAVLTDRQFGVGRYNINLNTSLLETGTYIFRLTTNNQSNSLRMIVNH